MSRIKFAPPRVSCFMSRTGSLRGFSLVELLVVVAIISVLVAMLFPALADMRERALTVSCMSNLRQCGIALNMRAMENRGGLPPATPNPQEDSVDDGFSNVGYPQNLFYKGANLWADTLGGDVRNYLDSMDVFTCPSYYGLLKSKQIKSIGDLSVGNGNFGDALYFTYCYFPGRAWPKVFPAGTYKAPINLKHAKGRYIIMADTYLYEDCAEAEFTSFRGVPIPPGTLYIGNHGRSFCAPIPMNPNFVGEPHYWSWAIRCSPIPTGGGNSLFSDGSVEWYGFSSLKRYDLRGAGAVSWATYLYAAPVLGSEQN